MVGRLQEPCFTSKDYFKCRCQMSIDFKHELHCHRLVVVTASKNLRVSGNGRFFNVYDFHLCLSFVTIYLTFLKAIPSLIFVVLKHSVRHPHSVIQLSGKCISISSIVFHWLWKYHLRNLENMSMFNVTVCLIGFR